MSEFAPTMLVLFMVFTFPLITLGTLGVRYMFLLNAARLAAQAASQAKSFTTNTSTTQLSATNLATQVANTSIGGWNGVSLSNITTNIIICPLSGGSVTRQSTALAKPADTNSNNYNIEVLLTGKITPLLMTPKSILGPIPGLTAPITTTARCSVFSEYPQGLNQ
ncbi:MAG TPA: hypothetical protein V6C76_04920 [Drouetiella sp.]